MSDLNQNIAKNTFILMGSQLTTWTLTLVLTIFLPRYLGAEGIGKLQFAMSLWLLVGMLISFGTGILLTKEIARAPQRTPELLSVVLMLRVLLFGVGYFSTVLLLHRLNYPADTITVAYIIGIANLVDQFATAYQSALQGLERMSILSLGTIVGKAVDTIVGIGLLLAGWGLYAIAALLIVSTAVRLVVQAYYLHQHYRLRFSFRWQTAFQMIRDGLPYLLSSIFLVGYLQMNVLIISFLINEETVGWYSAADRLFNTLLFIPTVFMMAVFPVFSRMTVNDVNYLNKLMAKSFDSLLLLGVPIGLGMTMVSGPIVRLLFGNEFINSGPILAVLGIALIFMYLNILLGQFLISIDRQNIWTVVMAVATVSLIVLDILLIPWAHQQWGNGAIGGAVAYGITELGMTVVGIILLPKGTLGGQTIWFVFRVLIAGAVMAVTVWYLRTLPIFVPIGIGAIVYFALVMVMQLVPKEDLQLVTSALQTFLTRANRPTPEAING